MITQRSHSDKKLNVDASLPLRGTEEARRNYGSIASSTGEEAIQVKNTLRESIAVNKMSEANGGGRDSAGLGYRCLTARTVSLPPRKWYTHIRIPGLFGRSSPHSNAVKTSKYTVFNFLFKNLWEQFHRLANIYFLFIALLNFVPAVEAFGKEVGFIPLLFVLLVTATKDIFEDYRRYRSDKEVNGRICRVYDWGSGQYRQKKWAKVCVGDFIQLSCDEAIPADILLLHSSDPNDICYIETANIDGETNLKQRQVAPGSVSLPSRECDEFSPQDFTGELHCEEPHNVIYEFNGFIKREDGSRVGVNRSSLLLRGCVLRNTTMVAGIVVYAGHQTKALLNNSGPRSKRSKLEKDINVDILWQAVILVIMCTSGAIVNGIWTARNLDNNVPFFPFSSDEINPALEGFVRFWTFIILYQIMIPLSLYVTIEIVKIAQVFFINWDRAMYYEPTNQPFQCRAININENLGQIQHIFSDKTGTLTENQMVFRCCSIAGLNYPHNLKGQFASYGTGANLSLLTSYMAGEEQTDFPMAPAQQVALDPVLSKDMKQDDDMIRDFFLVMAVCNTVVVSTSRHGHSASEAGGGDAGKVVYEAESPDEAALVEAARSYGYTLISRSPGQCSISTPNGGRMDFEVLQVLEFDPNRKCMSIIVRERGSSRIILFSKGADSVIYSNLARPSGTLAQRSSPAPQEDEQSHEKINSKSSAYDSQNSTPNSVSSSSGQSEIEKLTDDTSPEKQESSDDETLPNVVTFRQSISREGEEEEEEEHRTKPPNLVIFSQQTSLPAEQFDDPPDPSQRAVLTQEHLDMYARFGLRTLCMARRELTEEEYGAWLNERQGVELSLSNRDERLFQSACDIEKDLELLGATGIEDRLQEGVPEAIKSLRGAGLKVWVLTGDKQETAINIGYSSHLIDQDMDVIIINANSLDETRALLEEQKAEFQRGAAKTDLPLGDQPSGSIDSSDSVVARSPLLKFPFLKQCDDEGDDYKGTPKALVINGTTLHFALDPSLRTLFLDVAKRCQSVICCRAAPLQKAAVVNLVKQKLSQMTLAVGDGANDVSMIHKADVGVGIAGQEGMQAVMASDFAMARFKFLVRLLLVHGHWCYGRLARMMLYFFFKNVTFSMVIFWFQIFNTFSGSNLIDGINLITFNLLFTSLPIIVVGVADQDLRAPTLLKGKSFYQQGRCSKTYTWWLFWLTILDAFYESAVIFFIAYGVYYRSDVGLAEFGFVINMTTVVVVSFHLAVETLHWTVIHHVILWGSVLFAFVFNYIYCAIDSQQRFIDTLWVMQRTSARAEFWFSMLLTVILALFPRVLAKAMEQEFFPSSVFAARATESLLRGGRRRREGEDTYTVNANDNGRHSELTRGKRRMGSGGREEVAAAAAAGGGGGSPPASQHTGTAQPVHCHPL